MKTQKNTSDKGESLEFVENQRIKNKVVEHFVQNT